MSEQDWDSAWYAGENTWHPPPWLKNAPELSPKYWHSFFWGAGMVTSMVPRDIEPVTALEAIITTFTMGVGLMLNAVVISSFTSAFAAMDSKKELAGAELDRIRSYLVVKSVPSDLRARIMEYYEYIYTVSQLSEKDMFTAMPEHLNAQLRLSINKKLAGRCTFFRDISNSSLLSLILNMQPQVFVPGQVVVYQDQPLTAVYFINRGVVQLSRHDRRTGEDRSGLSLGEFDNFGIEDWQRGVDRKRPPRVRSSARAQTYCDVMMLPTEKLDAVKDDAEYRRKHTMRQEALKLAEESSAEGGSRKIPERGGRARMGLVAKLGMGLKCKSSQSTDMRERSSCDESSEAGGAESSSSQTPATCNRGLLFRSMSRKNTRSESSLQA